LGHRDIKVLRDDWGRQFIGIMLLFDNVGRVNVFCLDGLMGVEVGTFNFTAAHILNCCAGVVMYTYYAFTKNWITSNLFGLAVAFNSLEV
jgi:hypothetical protein